METIAAISSTNGFNTEDRIRRILLPAFSPEFVREHPEVIEQTMKLRLSSYVSEETYRAQVAAAVNFNVEAKLPAITAPTLILSGDSDAVVPVQNSQNLASRISGAELAIVEGGSHLFFIERPKEFNRIVIEFLKKH